MSAATDRWREARDECRDLDPLEAGDTLAAILDRIEQEAEKRSERGLSIDRAAWAEVLRIVREGS